MINHARTLLLNIAPNTYNMDTLGEEYIPKFDVLPIPHYLKLPHKILFGTDPDKVFLNFRAFELLSLAHRTELAEFVYALDPRITYRTDGNADFFRSPASVEIERISGVKRTNIHLSGLAKADNVKGRAYYEYVMRIINDTATTAIAELTPVTGASSLETVRWAVASPLQFKTARPVMRVETTSFLGLSDPAPLQNTGVNFQVSLGELNVDLLATEDLINFETESLFLPKNIEVEYAATPEMRMPRFYVVGDSQVISSWRLNVFARPASAISLCLPQLEFLGEPVYLQLFGVGNSVEPFATFKNIWFDHPIPAYRLAAFVLAMIYRMEEVRTKTNG